MLLQSGFKKCYVFFSIWQALGVTPRNGALLFYAVIMFLVFHSVLDKNMYSSLYSLKVIERGIREDCEPRCVCTTFTEDGAHHYCCDCIDDEILDRCRNRKCKAICSNDGGKSFECCHCPRESDNDGGCFPA